MITGATGFQNFFPSLTETLNYGPIVSLLLVAPPYVFMVFYSYFHSSMSDRFQNRFWFWMYPIPIVLVGCFVFMFTNDFGSRYFSLFLLNFAFTMNSTVRITSTSPAIKTNGSADLRLGRKLHPPSTSQTSRRNGIHEQYR